MSKYRKTALVDAEQFLPGVGKIPAGVYSSGHGDPRLTPHDWMLNTLEGPHTLRNGDYICTGPAGERWNVAQEIFEATYEPVPAQSMSENTMIERVARAIAGAIEQAPEYLAGDFPYQSVARAAIEAMDDPTAEMLNAAIDVDSYRLGDISPLGFRCSPQMLLEQCYVAMINAALQSEPDGKGEVLG